MKKDKSSQDGKKTILFQMTKNHDALIPKKKTAIKDKRQQNAISSRRMTNSMNLLKIFNKFKQKLWNLRRNAGTGSYHYLSVEQRQFVGDKSDILSMNLEDVKEQRDLGRVANNRVGIRGLIFLFQTNFHHLFKLTKGFLARNTNLVIKPNNFFLLLLDLLSTILILIFFFITSLSLSFNFSPHEILSAESSESNLDNFLIAFHITSLAVFTLRLFLGFFIAYYDCGVLITKISTVRKHYLRSIFLWDLCALVPIYFNTFIVLGWVSTSAPIYIQVLFFLKLKDVASSGRKITELISVQDNLEIILDLLKLAFKLLLISHVIACLWYYLSKDSVETSWINQKNLVNAPLRTKYTYSLYWSLTTIVTVGYGDISPQNTSEMIFSMGVMIVGSAVFGYSVSKIGNLLENMNKKGNELRKKLKVVNWYMSEKKLNADLQERVRKFLEFKFTEEGSYITQAEELLQKNLAGSLKEEVLQGFYSKVVYSFPILTTYFSKKTLAKLVNCIEVLNFRAGEVLDLCLEPLLYYVETGDICLNKVDLRIEGRKRAIYKKGDSFGEVGFFTERMAPLSLKTMSQTTLYAIRRENFLAILRQQKKDYEIFSEIKDRLMLSSDIYLLKKRCQICNSGNHLFSNCPLIFISSGYVIKKHQYCPLQKRRKFNRNKSHLKHSNFGVIFSQANPSIRKKFPALRNLKRVQTRANALASFQEEGDGNYQSNNQFLEYESKKLLIIPTKSSMFSEDLDSGELKTPRTFQKPPENPTKFIEEIIHHESGLDFVDNMVTFNAIPERMTKNSKPNISEAGLKRHSNSVGRQLNDLKDWNYPSTCNINSDRKESKLISGEQATTTLKQPKFVEYIEEEDSDPISTITLEKKKILSQEQSQKLRATKEVSMSPEKKETSLQEPKFSFDNKETFISERTLKTEASSLRRKNQDLFNMYFDYPQACTHYFPLFNMKAVVYRIQKLQFDKRRSKKTKELIPGLIGESNR